MSRSIRSAEDLAPRQWVGDLRYSISKGRYYAFRRWCLLLDSVPSRSRSGVVPSCLHLTRHPAALQSPCRPALPFHFHSDQLLVFLLVVDSLNDLGVLAKVRQSKLC